MFLSVSWVHECNENNSYDKDNSIVEKYDLLLIDLTTKTISIKSLH